VKNESKADECWQDLANAIIVQATADYRHALRMLRENKYNAGLLYDKESLEEFFRSDWFQVLTRLDGRRVLNDLQKGAAQ
jgi:hypothetical protein